MKSTKNNIFETNIDFPISAKLYGKVVKNLAFNQIIPNDLITLNSSTSVVPTANLCGSYITIINPIVGHKVHCKITTSNPKLRLCWYKTNDTAYDFATGEYLDTSSTESNVYEGIYTITQDMVHSGTGYLQLYYFVFAGMPTGSHTITVQLTDLTAMGWENITLDQFHALFPNEPYNYTAVSSQTIRCLEKTKIENADFNQELSLPLYAIPNENKKCVMNQLVQNGNFESVSGWSAGSCSYTVSNNVATIVPNAIHSTFRIYVGGVNGHKYFFHYEIKYTLGETYIENIMNVQTSNIAGTGNWEKINKIITVSNTNQYVNFFDYDNNVRSQYQLKNVQIIDLTLMYGAGNEPTTIDQIPSFIKDKYRDYNTGSFDYSEWLLRDTWENTKQTKYVRVVDLGTSTNYGGSNGNYWLRGLISNAKKGVLGQMPNIVCALYQTVNSAYTLNVDKTIMIEPNSTEIMIRDTRFNSAGDLVNSLNGVLLFYEVATPIITTTSTCLVGKAGKNNITQYDQNNNVLDCDFDIQYNELRNYKVGGKLVKYVNDKTVKDIYVGNQISSLLGKQNVATTLSATSSSLNVGKNTDGSFFVAGGINDDRKHISLVANHKYFVWINATNITENYSQARFSLWNKTIDAFKSYIDAIVVGNNYFVKIENITDTASYDLMFRLVYSASTSISLSANKMILLDLTELGLDNLTAQEFYNRYKGDLDKLANGETIRTNHIYERPMLPSGFTELKAVKIQNDKNNGYTNGILTNIKYSDITKIKCKLSQDILSTGDLRCVLFTKQSIASPYIAFNLDGTIIQQGLTNFTYTGISFKDLYNNPYNFEFNFTNTSIGNIRFGSWIDATWSHTLSWFNVELYNNNVLIANYIPAKRHDNEIGMLDLVNGVFYTNQGTGTFVAIEY